MSRRKAPGNGDRHKGTGRPVANGGLGRRSAASIAPPPVPEGKRRCPVCRNAVTPVQSGALRKHRDLFGEECWNRRTGDEAPLTEAPPVALPKERGRPAAVQSAPSPQSRVRRPASEPSRLDVGTGCRECGKWLPGERSLCGRCSVLRGRAS